MEVNMKARIKKRNNNGFTFMTRVAVRLMFLLTVSMYSPLGALRAAVGRDMMLSCVGQDCAICAWHGEKLSCRQEQ